MQLAIIDYGMGNLLSVKNALEAVGVKVSISAVGDDLREAHGIVLPGVGAFGRGMQGLRERGFLGALEREVRERKKPILGICLGLQLFASRGTELGDHEGLGWIDGVVERLPSDSNLRVPHVGWNDVRGHGALFSDIPPAASFYFVHSFHLMPASKSAISGTTEYGTEIVSAIEQENVYAVQFHPEKSHKHGLALLKNFVGIVHRS